MGLLNLGLIAAGAVLIVVGFMRARGPWARYKALREQEANISRYESWRGGLRDSGVTGASVAMGMLRDQARNGTIIGFAGAILFVVGLIVS